MTYFDVAQTLDDARAAREEIVDSRVDSALADAKFCFDGLRLRVSATNVGRSTIDTLNVSILVDGVVVPGFIANVETNRNAGFWEPGFNATFNKTGYGFEPERVVLFTPEGVPAYAPVYTCPALNDIVITPASVSGLDIGAQQEFTAIGYDQFGALFIPEGYDWSSTCGTIEAVDFDTVRFTAGTVAGDCEISVSSEGVSEEAPISIDPDPPVSMVVSFDPTGVPAGGTASFTTVIRDQYGNVNASSPVTWTTNAGAITNGGVLTAQTTAQMGRSVTATTTHGVSDSATVDVYPAAPATALVTPDPEDVTVGETETFSVVLRDAYGNVNATAPVTWTTTAGTITQAGALTAQTTAQDGLSVTATSGAASDSATVHVKPDVPSTIVVTPDPTTVAAGATRQFTAVVYDSYGNVNDTSIVTWTTNGGSIDGDGLLTAQTLAQNGRTVTATSGAASDTATVDVWPAAPSSALVTPDAAGVTAGTTRQYTAVFYDPFGNVNGTAPVTWTTNAGSIDANGLLTAQTTAATGKTVTATSGAASDSAIVDIIAAQPSTITLTPAGAGVTAGTTRQYTAVARDQYGNVNSTATIAWSTNGGSISSAGLLTAQTTAANGKTVTATWGAVTASVTVDIWPDAPATVSVSPDPRGVAAGGSATFTATVRDQYGNLNTTAAVSWSTNAGSVSAGGVLTAQTTAQMGRSVTATAGGVSGSATVDVYAAAPSTALVSPDPVDVTVGTTQAFTVVLRDQYNNVNSTAGVTWTTDAGSISGAGVLTAQTVAADGKTVTATSGAASDSATVHVKPGAPSTMIVTPDGAGVPAGSTQQYSVAMYDSYGNANTTAIVTWTTNGGTIGSGGLLTAQTTAATGKTVTATTSTASDSATVDIWAAAPSTATLTPAGAGVTAGGTRQYTVVLRDVYGNVNSTATVSWSTNGGSISSSGLLTAQTTAATGKTVTATSGAASATVNVDIIAAQPASITVTPAGAGVRAGTTQQYTATLRDQYNNVNSTATVTWSTNAGTITSGGLLTAQTTSANGKTVTATWTTVSGSATVDIWPDAPASVVVSPDPRGVAAGGSAAFTATVRDQYNNLNTSATVSWSTNAGSITSGGVLTAQTAAATGKSVTATASGVSGSSTVDVYPAAVDHITVSPSSATVYLNRTQQFTATVYDVYNNANASVTVSWSATSGSISSGGLYVAPSTGGSVTVTASASGVSGTASVTVRREAHVDAMATYKNNAPASSFRKGVDTVEVRTTVRDHENALVQNGASVTVEFVDPNGVVQQTSSGTTSSGIASTSYVLPSNARQGTWTARVTTIAGTNLAYNSGANVVSSVTFTVTA